MNKKLMLSILFVSAFAISAFPKAKTEVEKIVEKARTKKGKVVYASPKGGNGTLTIAEAVKELRPGMILKLAPGRYQAEKKSWIKRIEIETENVVVEGDGSGRLCELTLVLWGRGCVVRNICIYGVEAEEVTIVDSRTNPVICSSGTHSTSYIYNCLMHYINLYANNSDIYVENCTLVRMFTPPQTRQAQWKVSGGGAHQVGGYDGAIYLGQFARKGEIHFKNCILYTNGFLFRNRWGIASMSVGFDNSIVWAEQGMFAGNKDAKKLKEIKQVCRVRFGEKNYEEQAELNKKPAPAHHQYWWGQNSAFDYMPTAGSVAAKKGMGCYVGGNGIPCPRPDK